MIKKRKKQSFKESGLSDPTVSFFSPTFLFLFCVVPPLIVFFLYGTFINQHFFLYLIVALACCVGILFFRQKAIAAKESEAELRIEDIRERINLVQAEIDIEVRAIQSYREKIVNFSQLKGLTEKLSRCLTLEDTSRCLSEEVDKLFQAKDITHILYLFHSKTGELGISSSQKGQMRVNLKSKKGDMFDQWVVKTMQPLLIEDATSDYRFDEERIRGEMSRPVKSLISVPLMVGNKALGILRIDSPDDGRFTTEHLRFLQTVGDLGAVAVENAQLYERIEQLAIRDSLTGLFLRRYLKKRMPEEVARHLRRKRKLSFMMIDLDHFKKYNDKFGHVAGDIVLKTVGDILLDFFDEPGQLVCRYGGEEFAVLLPNCTKEKAEKMAEDIRATIADKTILLRRQETNVRVSIGVSGFPKDARMTNELILKADQALYKAKKQGRNRVCSA